MPGHSRQWSAVTRDGVALIKRERLAGRVPVSHGGVIAQVWRGGNGRQVPLARLLAGVDIAALDDGPGLRAGMLLACSELADAIGAAVVCLAGDGDDVLTSDPGGLRALAQVAGVHVELVPVECGTVPPADPRPQLPATHKNAET